MKICEMTKTHNGNDLHTITAECDIKSLPLGPGFPLFFLPSGSRFLCENFISIKDTRPSFCQKDISNPKQQISRHTPDDKEFPSTGK